MQVFIGTEVLSSVDRVTSSTAAVGATDVVDTVSGLRSNIQVACELKYASTLDRSCHDIVVTHALMAERMCPGTFRDCIQNIRDLVVGDQTSTVRKSFNGTLVGRRANRSDIQDVVRQVTQNRPAWVVKMISDALEIAGFAGKILVEKVDSDRPSLELVSGYSFKATSHLRISETLQAPKICVIDGFIENVSEIHHVLEAASSRKQAVVLIARNFSDDVKNTLSVNYNRGTLKVLPYTVQFDLDGANVLVDIAIVTGCDLVSSLKGDLISTINFETLPTVASTVTYPDKVIINNPKTAADVVSQVKKLREKRIAEYSETVTGVLDARIRSLTPSQIVVRLPNDPTYVLTAQAFDKALRAVKSAVDHGVVDTSDGVRLALSYTAKTMYATKAAEVLKDLGAVIKP